MKIPPIGLIILSAAVVPPAFAEVDTNSESYKKTYDRVYAERMAENKAKADAAKSNPPQVENESDGAWTLKVGPVYAKTLTKQRATAPFTTAKSNENLSFLGGRIAAGYSFDDSKTGFSEIQVESGISYDASDVANIYEIPLLVRYSYNFKLTPSTFLSVGPAVGASVVRTEDIYDDGYWTDVGLKYGAGIGLTHQFSKNCSIAIGYDYFRITNLEHEISSVTVETSGIQQHQVAISLNFKI